MEHEGDGQPMIRLVTGPIMSDGMEFPAKPKCEFRGEACLSLRFPDGYPYCSILPDERPQLRPGMGAQVRGLEPICELPAIGGL